ncbi:hypothetical protein ACFLZ4_01680 [Patescibacteria group bacterium]
MKKPSKTLLFLLAYFIISLFVFRKLLLSEGFLGMRDDWVMPPFASQYIGQAQKILYAWSSNFLGINYVRRFGDYPYAFFGILASIFGFGGQFFTKFIITLTLTLSGFFSFLLLRSFKMKDTSAFVGSLLYMLSPMFYNATVSGYFVFLISYALLPVFLMLFRQIIDYEGKVPFGKTLISGLVLRMIIGQDNFMFITPILIGFFYIFEIIYKRKTLKDIGRDTRKLLPVVFVAIILSLSSFANIFINASDSFGLVSKGLESWNVGVAPRFFYSFLLDGAGYKYFLLSVPKGALIAWLVFGAIILMLIFTSILFIDKDRYLIFFSILSLTFIFLFKGDNPPFGYLYKFIFETIPIMKVTFRNIQYLTVFVSLGYAYMLGRTLDVISEHPKAKGSAYSIIVGNIILILLVFEIPFMSGNLSGNVQTINFNSIYKDLIKEIEEDPSDARTLWLPISQPIAYKGKIIPGLDSFFVGSSKGFVMNDGAGSLDRIFSEEIYTTKNPESLSSFFALLNIDKVILRSDFYSHHPDFMSSTFWREKSLLWNNKTLRENVNKISSLEFLEERGPVKIFKNNFFTPHFYISDKHVGIGGDLVDFTKVNEIGNYTPFTSYKFIGKESGGIYDDIYYFSTKITNNLPNTAYASRGIATDAPWAWPECTVSPVNFTYKGVLIKEKILSLGKDSPRDHLEDLVWFSSKRICEIDIYREELSEQDIASLLDKFLEGFKKSYNIILKIKEDPWEDYISLARKVAFYYERSLSTLVRTVPEATQREDIKSLYWDLYSLSLANLRDIDSRDNSYDYFFTVNIPGSYDLYSDLSFNGEVDIFDPSGVQIGSTRVSEGSKTSNWNRVYRGLDIFEIGDILVKVNSQKSSNLADTSDEVLKEKSVSDPIAIVTNWEPSTDYLITFDYSFGTGDFVAIFEEKMPNVGYYRYGDGNFDWYELNEDNIPWIASEIFYREFNNALSFDKGALESLGACVYWEGDTCYRRFSALIRSSAVSKDPILHVRPMPGADKNTERPNIKNIQITKISRPNLAFSNFSGNTLTSEQSASISHKKINQSKYLLTIESFREDFKLVFSEGFSTKWKLYLVDKATERNIFSGLFEKLFKDPNPFETAGKKPLFEDSHEKVNDYANSWVIDKETTGSDGAPITIIVEFGPQKAHYVWVFVSSLSFTMISIYLVIAGVKKLYAKK